MTRDTKVQGLASIVLIAALLGSAALATRLSALSGKHRLTYTDRAEEGQPWEVAVGIAMGAFRGIFVNWLWIRANDLKEDGKFYEANQLAEIITKLQPRFPRVWVFHAWNMAYNISVSTQTPSERWEWVNKGISLLRDEAIPANPHDLLLHKELAWTYLHKVAGITDDANGYYKRRFAQEWTIVLGIPPLKDESDRSRDKAIEKYAAWLRTIAESPDTKAGLLEKEPSVAALRQRLAAEVGIERLEPELLVRYEFAKAVGVSTRRDVVEKGQSKQDLAFQALVADPDMKKAWDAIIPAIRKRLLIEHYHMEPDRMVRYTQTYGPIDWRHPAAHALYWSARGVDLAMTRYRGEMDRPDFDFLNTDRVTVQAIQELFRGGEVYFDFLASFEDPGVMFLTTPNVHFIQAYADVLNSMFDPLRSGIFNDRAKRQFTMLWHGYENFIREAITYYYRRGWVMEAEEWQHKLRNDPRKNTQNEKDLKEMSYTIEEFVETELKGEAARPAIAVAQVQGSLVAAYASGLLASDQQLFNRQFAYALRLHRYYMEEQLRATPAGGATQRMAQMDPDFEILAGQIFAGFLTSLSMENARNAYFNAPDNLKAWGYEAVRRSRFAELAAQDAKHGGKTLEQLFPMPQDFEEYSRDIQERIRRREDRSKDIQSK
jgi:hypothetical protein